MRQRLRIAALFVVGAGIIAIRAQGPAFDVVSIKLNTAGVGPGTTPPQIQRPDGGFTIINQPIRPLIARAYPGQEIVGLPDWATREHFDIRTTSTLTTASSEDRVAMLRAMLADRLHLVVHVEKREQQVYDLVLARKDGKLGPGLTPSALDCTTSPPQPPARREVTEPPPPCTIRTVDAAIRKSRGDKNVLPGDLTEGEAALTTLTQLLSISAGRPVVDKTGLTGSYKVSMLFDMMALRRPPSVDAPTDAAPSVFEAVQQQLGLKLESSNAMRDVLVIDRLERPTPD